MSYRYGFIGNEEIDEALEKLREDRVLLEDKLFWIERPHQGNWPKLQIVSKDYDFDGVIVRKKADSLWEIEEEETGFTEIATDESELRLAVSSFLEDGRRGRIYDYDDLIAALEEGKKTGTNVYGDWESVAIAVIEHF